MVEGGGDPQKGRLVKLDQRVPTREDRTSLRGEIEGKDCKVNGDPTGNLLIDLRVHQE